MATPTLFEIQCALMSGVADHASRKNQQINMYPVPAGWNRIDYRTDPERKGGQVFAWLMLVRETLEETETSRYMVKVYIG